MDTAKFLISTKITCLGHQDHFSETNPVIMKVYCEMHHDLGIVKLAMSDPIIGISWVHRNGRDGESIQPNLFENNGHLSTCACPPATLCFTSAEQVR